MGRLAEIAGTENLTGQVAFTSAAGVTQTFEDEDTALKAIGSKKVFHHRGAFFEEGCKVRGYVPPKPAEKKGKTKPKAD